MILVSLILALAEQGPPDFYSVTPQRPRDPFVFRCVLDKRARTLVAALDEEMWVAWDTSTGCLVNAWKGGVNFDGAVYTTVHGPQPTSKGQSYITEFGRPPWVAYVDGKQLETQTRYVGYTLRDKGVVLEWKVTFGEGREVIVQEWPDFWRRKAGPVQVGGPQGVADGPQPSLRRHFTAIGLRAGEQINLVFREDVAQHQWAMRKERARNEKVVVGVNETGGSVTAEHSVAELPLEALADQNVLMLAFQPISLPEKEQEKK